MQSDDNKQLAPVNPEDERIKQFRLKLQAFLEQLNSLPPQDSVGETPDGKASTILISHVETTLDEFFFGDWDTVKFRWQVIANEVVGAIVLEVRHPVTGKKLKRTGAAAIQIMVDAAPKDLRGQEKNRWYLNPDNKKSQALDMGFPKLKAECIKNAANSLGKLFGRDLNRTKSDTYRGKVPKNKTRWNQTQTTDNGQQSEQP